MLSMWPFEFDVTRAIQKTALKYRILALNAAFSRLVYLQFPTDQKDMAEACGSRTHHSTREGPNHRL